MQQRTQTCSLARPKTQALPQLFRTTWCAVLTHLCARCLGALLCYALIFMQLHQRVKNVTLHAELISKLDVACFLLLQLISA